MALNEYRRKRDFAQTAEPAPRRAARGSRQPTFVIQLHHARSRHYDFRLEVDGVLKSWAVPKGPSLNPADKRLAVEVEDHPLAYAAFEGEIAAGNYGAGRVEIFDRGHWSTTGDAGAQLEQGRLQFELFGEKLRGTWNLIRTTRKRRQPEWLLIKGRDRHADELEADDLLERGAAPEPQAPSGRAAAPRSASAESDTSPGIALRRIVGRLAKLDGAVQAQLSPGPFAPELARLYPSPPEGDDWLHEVKWDGYRILCTIVDGQPTLWSRNALEWTGRLPSIVAALARLGVRTAQLDGELVTLVNGASDFNALQARLSGDNTGPLVYIVFDLIHLQGWSLANCALLDRKQILRSLLEMRRDPALQFSEHHRGAGRQAFDAAVENALEGIVCKRAASPYRAGRGDDWRKVKRVQSDEFAVVGFTPPKGSRNGFGSLLLAAAEADGSWRYVGRVGSGFSQSQLLDLTRTLKESRSKVPSARVAAMDATLRNAHWVEPDKVAEVYYRGIGNLGLLRQPSLKTLRMDKRAADLMHEATRRMQKEGGMSTAKRPPARTMGTGSAAPGRRAKPEAKAASSVRARQANVRRGKAVAQAPAAMALTHPERIVFPQDGISKNDVFNYYCQVMTRLLPPLRNKPLSIVRCPSGIGAQCFFQKHLTPGLKRVGRTRLKEESGRFAEYLFVDDAEGLLELVQFNAIEFHPWAAAVQDTEHAQYLVFDLDPAPDIAWLRVAAAALDVRDLLGKVGLRSFVRTSGGKGLHVVVPLNPPSSWDDAKKFSHALAQSFASSRPNEFVSVASKEQRGGRIFIDYLRNSRGATSVASYSLRARPGAPVATPLRWSELSKLPGGDAFTIHNVVARIKRLRDPWSEFSSVRQNLDKIREIGALNGWRAG